MQRYPTRSTLGAALLCVALAGQTLTSPCFAQTAATSQYIAVIDGVETPAPAIPMGDEAIVAAALAEGKNNSQVMAHLLHLTETLGPRLTGSTNLHKANEWTRDQFESWGVPARMEQWGEIATGFDRGPCSAKVLLLKQTKADDGAVTVDRDTIRNLQFTTLAWTRGTNGPVRAPVVKMPESLEELAAIKDQVAGAWVLIKSPAWVNARSNRDFIRASLKMGESAREKVASGADPASLKLEEQVAVLEPAGYLISSRDERVWTGGTVDWRERTADNMYPDIYILIRGSDYDFINSRVYDKAPIELEIDLDHTLTPGPIPVYNTIAEIKGSLYPDEYIVVSGHLDSWDGPGSLGAMDNATGSAVTLEAARILAAVGARPDRTIRFMLWTGEEQGLLGSLEWVKANAEEVARTSVAFVDDGGTNYQGGFATPDIMIDMLAAATAPTNNQFWSETDQKFLNVNLRRSGDKLKAHGSSDHASFNKVGTPGFFWDESGRGNYGYSWHTQNDRPDQAIEEYLIQSAVNSAITAYRLACAPTLLPRLPVENTQPNPSAPTPLTPAAAKPEDKAAAAADNPAPAPTATPAHGTR